MMDRPQKTLFVLSMAALSLVLVIGALVFMLLHGADSHGVQSGQSMQTVQKRAEKKDSRSGVYADKAHVCETVAVLAFNAYVTPSENRERLLVQYFTADAEGLTYTPEDFTPQDTVDSTMVGIIDEDADSVTCAIHNGLESPWIMRLSGQKNRWKVESIEAPTDVYTQQLPDDKQASGGESK
ncbi:hypothetical protein B9G54_04455 [Alloscardovia macacae]|uniref:Cobalt transporter n=1 Tax=Alloscardovia macacae TaxID=1160091 RepID=A0A1Y2T355_9BIFI|nr:hypothetical protein [Alloscardovia macacae]OTA26447.1 hypothetical protein B9G54_04455 [Alloscardovia macacae]OTA29873.1 hypothetical protein B9T39_01990 [Alloscardovia macacae]